MRYRDVPAALPKGEHCDVIGSNRVDRAIGKMVMLELERQLQTLRMLFGLGDAIRINCQTVCSVRCLQLLDEVVGIRSGVDARSRDGTWNSLLLRLLFFGSQEFEWIEHILLGAELTLMRTAVKINDDIKRRGKSLSRYVANYSRPT
jgi:hypothetical protein